MPGFDDKILKGNKLINNKKNEKKDPEKIEKTKPKRKPLIGKESPDMSLKIRHINIV